MEDVLIEPTAEIAGGAAEETLSRQPLFRRLSPVTRFFLGMGAAAVMGLAAYAVVTFFIR